MNSPHTEDGVNQPEESIIDFLSPGRITLDLDTSSRKRLFEYIAEVSAKELEDIEEDCIFKTITERERLGSTGLGRGIAVPHGRIESLESPVISLVRLKHPIDYDAPDNRPVWLAVGLLVPLEANETHLKLLSKLATCFQDADFVKSLRQCQYIEQVSQLFEDV